MKLEHVSCDLCGGKIYIERYRKPDNYLWLNQFSFPVVECKNCGLVYVNPRPIFDEIGQFYPPGYHDGRNTPEHHDRYSLQFEYIKNYKGKRILDIGCARGDWLGYIRGQWPDAELHGVDAFSAGVNHSITFHNCMLTDAVLPANYFDLITSWAVLEHVHTPLRYFEVVSRVLKDGGKFVFLVTNSESFYGKYGFNEDVPRHLYHFSEKTLDAYANKVGLKLVGIEYEDRIWDGRGWGTFAYGFGRLAGFTWIKSYLKRLNWCQRAAMRFGAIIDKVIFSTHWEARMRRSGIIIVTMEK